MSNKRKKQSALNKTIQILISHNEWRRGDAGSEMTNPIELGLAIDHAASELMKLEKFIGSVNALEVKNKLKTSN